VVDDNADAAAMLATLLEMSGHETHTAHDGAEALRAADRVRPHLILLDIGLPVMNGYAVVQKLRALPNFRHVHVAAVTGWGQEEDRRKAREAGFDSHFTKPLSPTLLEDLLATIAHRVVSGSGVASTPRTRLTDSGAAF